VDDPEPKFGYAVIGEVHPDRVIGHEGASAGDVLFLTKPLCSGLVTTAVKRGLCPPTLERQAVDVMMTLNREAAGAMIGASATAATDVTGFGLIGHLVNLAGGADIEFTAVPFLDGVRELADLDFFPSGSRRNHAAYRDAVDWNGLPEVEQLMLCDAQTSGGLLVAIPSRRAVTFVDQQPRGHAILRQNLDALGFKERAHLVRADVVRWLDASPDAIKSADFVFLDPPYDDVVLDRALKVLDREVAGATVLAEHS